jgi:ABC-type transport system involved in multi-copper enzyme maturation permease subunit
MSFGEILLWTFSIFLFFAYLMILWTIFSDLFSDRETSGWGKALWIVFLIFLPLIGSLVYLIVRGRGMQERKIAQLQEMQQVQDSYIRQVAGSGGKSAAEQIADAKNLLDAGAITQEEFDALKAKAMA